MDDIVDITLFRHGLTEANQQKVYLGWSDSPLREEAIQQLATYSFQEEDYDYFVSSDLGRCLFTCKRLFPYVDPLALRELREMNFGAFEGKTYEELKEDEAYGQWMENMLTSSPPDGESFEAFSERVERGWKKIVNAILQRDDQQVFVVSHGGVIRCLLHRFAPFEKDFWEWKIPHGTGYVLKFSREQLRRGAPCISLQEVRLTGNAPG